MILVADSGSTKTQWVWIENNVVMGECATQGLNPYFCSNQALQDVMTKVLNELTSRSIEAVYFYGAGCGNFERQEEVRNALMSIFAPTTCTVESDLIGAARATCHNQPGLVCILGTGMGVGLYDGFNFAVQRPGNGFILGDEGSGAVFGKNLVSAYLNGDTPTEEKEYLEQAIGLSRPEILDKVYRKERPNEFLASLAKIVSTYPESSYFRALILENFENFADCQLKNMGSDQYKTVHVIGSFGYYNQDVLDDALRPRGYRLGSVHASPMEGLLRYHLT